MTRDECRQNHDKIDSKNNIPCCLCRRIVETRDYSAHSAVNASYPPSGTKGIKPVAVQGQGNQPFFSWGDATSSQRPFCRLAHHLANRDQKDQDKDNCCSRGGEDGYERIGKCHHKGSERYNMWAGKGRFTIDGPSIMDTSTMERQRSFRGDRPWEQWPEGA